VAYDINDTGPSAASGQPNGTTAAASSIRASTWPYQRHADKALPHNILLRPPASAGPSDDPTLAEIVAVQNSIQRLERTMRLVAAPWILEPPDSESFHKAAGITMPAQDGAFHEVVRIVCPAGRNGVLRKIANVVVGGAWSDFDGNAIWQIVRNPPAGAATAAPERNYDNILASYGLINNPAPISAIRIFENDVIAWVIKNVGLPVAGENVGALLDGWFYPRTWDDQYEQQDQNVAW
jgi:hypothetical protein